MTICLAASPGGHLDELEPIATVFSEADRVWVTLPGPRGDALREAGERVVYLPEYGRGAVAQGRLWAAAVAFVARERPRLVVTTGAGAAVPVCWAARARGGDVFFIETSARIHAPSLSGRLVGPIATRRFIQWPELSRHFSDPVLCRPILFDAVRERRTPEGTGTFVTVGTHTARFDRLLDMSERAIEQGLLPTPALLQTGAAEDFASAHAEVQRFLSPDANAQHISRARYVVSHGGAGTLAAALRAGRRPLVLPRRAEHGEHFDDHQSQIVERMSSTGLVVPLVGEITQANLEAADAPLDSVSGEAWGPSVADAVRSEAQARGHLQ